MVDTIRLSQPAAGRSGRTVTSSPRAIRPPRPAAVRTASRTRPPEEGARRPLAASPGGELRAEACGRGLRQRTAAGTIAGGRPRPQRLPGGAALGPCRGPRARPGNNRGRAAGGADRAGGAPENPSRPARDARPGPEDAPRKRRVQRIGRGKSPGPWRRPPCRPRNPAQSPVCAAPGQPSPGMGGPGPRAGDDPPRARKSWPGLGRRRTRAPPRGRTRHAAVSSPRARPGPRVRAAAGLPASRASGSA